MFRWIGPRVGTSVLPFRARGLRRTPCSFPNAWHGVPPTTRSEGEESEERRWTRRKRGSWVEYRGGGSKERFCRPNQRRLGDDAKARWIVNLVVARAGWPEGLGGCVGARGEPRSPQSGRWAKLHWVVWVQLLSVCRAGYNAGHHPLCKRKVKQSPAALSLWQQTGA